MARRPRWTTIALLTLILTTAVASTGWFLSAREGRGVPPECYTIETPNSIRFDAPHGVDTLRSIFAVAESDDEIMLGYWEEVEDGPHTLMAYPARLTYRLIEPLGDRQVVDPAGDAIPAC